MTTKLERHRIDHVKLGVGSGGEGGVTGPSSSLDNSLARFDGTSGSVLQGSSVLLDDNDNFTGVNSIKFILNPTHTQEEGAIHWDDNDKTLNLDTEVDGTAIQVGQEVVVRCTNKTGSTILNGSIVYVDDAQGNRPTIQKATKTATACRSTIGIATHDIENNATGYVTTFGLVRDIDTSSFSEGDCLYLSDTPGVATNVAPSFTEEYIFVGIVLYSHATEGIILCRIIIDPDYSLRGDWAQNGFPNRTDSTLSWSDSSPDRTFSIQPTSTSFDYYVSGVKYTSTGDTIQITDTEGIHIIYYDTDGSIASSANPDIATMSTVIRSRCIICIVYWDTSASTAIYIQEERHGKSMSPVTHAYLHFVHGLAYISGLGLNTINADGAGATADAQFGIDAGRVADEDIDLPISAIASTTGLPIYYMLGASEEWQKHTESGFSARTYDGTSSTRLAYNQYTGGAWQLTQVASNSYVLYHVFATTEKDYPMISVMGQNTYLTKPAAQSAALSEIKELLLDKILFPEIRPIATVIFQTNTSYANSINARIISTEEGDDYIDWRSETISRAEISTTDHGSLTGLGNDDHTIYLLADGTREVGGNLTFTNSTDGVAWSSSTKLTAPADGDLFIKNAAGTQGIEFDTSTTSGRLVILDQGGSAADIQVDSIYSTVNNMNIHNSKTGGDITIDTHGLSTEYDTGYISIHTGNNSNAGDYASGPIKIYSGDTTTDGDTGDLWFYSGVAGAGIADAGDLVFAVNGAPGTGTTMLTLDASTQVSTFGQAIRLGTTSDTTEGNLRWTGSDIEVYKSSTWTSLTSATASGDYHFLDDEKCSFGNTSVSPDYWFTYNSSSTQFEFWSTNYNGVGGDAAVLTVNDGSGTLSVIGSIYASSGTALFNASTLQLANGSSCNIYNGTVGGTLVINTAYGVSGFSSGVLYVKSGNVTSGSGNSGQAWFYSGPNSGSGGSGHVKIFSGSTVSGTPGSIYMTVDGSQGTGDKAITILGSSANVGVWTDSPSEQFEVSDTNTAVVRLNFTLDSGHDQEDIFGKILFGNQNGENDTAAQKVSSYINCVHTRAGTAHSWEDAGLTFGTLDTADAFCTERMRIHHNGYISFGTTSYLSDSYMNSYTDLADGYVHTFHNDGNNINRFGIKVSAGEDDQSSSVNYYFSAFDGNDNAEGYLRVDSGTFELVQASDERRKTDITDSSIDSLQILNDIKVREFRHTKGSTSKERADNSGNLHRAGFIAQELEQVFPDMVSEDPYGNKVISQMKLIPVLIKAVQELTSNLFSCQAQILELQDEIATLKSV